MDKAAKSTERLIGLIHGPDQPGLVARAANWIFERGGNIQHADQHRDDGENIFFQRIEWDAAGDGLKESRDFESAIRASGMEVQVFLANEKPKVALFVSKIAHCFLDILGRYSMGELPCEITAVISNHPDHARMSQFYGIPFHHIPVTRETKEEAEARQLTTLGTGDNAPDLIVLARYMQILSEKFLNECGCPVINIHHSFLPAFAGARPYHQAHARGVKLIGATAHYATAILDDGPIIQQSVSPVSHRHSVEDLIRRGRDLEKSVLAQAVRWHLDHRVLVFGNKTVVFD